MWLFDYVAEEVRKSSLQIRSQELDNSVSVVSPLVQAEEAYWDAANQVLMNTESWSCLPSAMEQFDTRFELIKSLITSDFCVSRALSRREVAARKLQRFFREKMDTVFKWNRVFKKMDHVALVRIRQTDVNATFITLNSKLNSTTIAIPAYARDSSQVPMHTKKTSTRPVTSAAPSGLSRPDSAPNLLARRQSGNFKVEQPYISRRGTLDEDGYRPGTAPAQAGTIDSITEIGIKKTQLLRSSSSMAPALAARKMVFSEHLMTEGGKVSHNCPDKSVAIPSSASSVGREVPETSFDMGASAEVLKAGTESVEYSAKREKSRRRKQRFEEIIGR